MTNNIINTNTDSARNANYIAARITRPTLLSEIDPTVMGIIGAKDGLVSDVIFDVNTFEYEDGRANGDIVGMIINQGDEMSPDYCIDVRNVDKRRYPPYEANNLECEVTNHGGFLIFDIAAEVVLDRAVELWGDKGIKFDNIQSIDIKPFSGILNSTEFYKNVLTKLPHSNPHINTIEGGSLVGELDGKFNISKESGGLIKIAYYDDESDVTKLTDLEHLSEDFNKLHEDFRGTIESQEVIISMDDLQNANDNEIIL